MPQERIKHFIRQGRDNNHSNVYERSMEHLTQGGLMEDLHKCAHMDLSHPSYLQLAQLIGYRQKVAQDILNRVGDPENGLELLKLMNDKIKNLLCL
jgi:hypothetical protein